MAPTAKLSSLPEKAEKDGRGIDPEGVPTCLNDSNTCLPTGNT